MADEKQFTANGTVVFEHVNRRFSQLAIGQIGNADFGTGSLLLKYPTRGISGTPGVHLLRTITAADFAALQDKTIQVELPADTDLTVELAGSTSPDLYVQWFSQRGV